MSGRTSLGPVITAIRGASSCPLPSSAPMLVILAASTASASAIALASALFAPILPIRVPSCNVTMKAPAQSGSVFTSTSACGWQRSIPSWHSVAPRRATGACLTIPAPGNAWAMAFRLSSPGACVTGRSDRANSSTALRWTRSHCLRPCRPCPCPCPCERCNQLNSSRSSFLPRADPGKTVIGPRLASPGAGSQRAAPSHDLARTFPMSAGVSVSCKRLHGL